MRTVALPLSGPGGAHALAFGVTLLGGALRLRLGRAARALEAAASLPIGFVIIRGGVGFPAFVGSLGRGLLVAALFGRGLLGGGFLRGRLLRGRLLRGSFGITTSRVLGFASWRARVARFH